MFVRIITIVCIDFIVLLTYNIVRKPKYWRRIMFELVQSPGRYIMRVSSGLLHCLDSFVEGTSMTPGEARILQFIAASTEPLNQRDIETEYGYSAATVSEMIKNMEAKGLVQRDTDPHDRRKKRLTVPVGIAAQVNDMRGKMVAMEADLIRDISPEKLDVFMEVIRQMSANIPPRGSKSNNA